MKHNAKATAKSIGSSSAFCANPYIPTSIVQSGNGGIASSQGRHVRFETTIIQSPVLRSARSRNTSHALTEDDLGSINSMMSSLQIRGGTSPDLGSLTDKMSKLRVRGNTVTTKSKTAHLPTNNTNSTSSIALTMAPTPPPSPAVDGRYDALVFSPKKKMQVPVKRSARFRLADP